MWLVPGTAFSATTYIEITGTLVPVEQQYGHRVYKLQSGGQFLHLAISGLRSYSGNINSDKNEWYYLKSQGHRRFRLVGDNESIEQLKTSKPCDAVKIRGFINYNTGLLRVRNLEPAKNDILLAGCSF